MAKIYADLCEAGMRTVKGEAGIVAVPAKWLEATKQELVARGRTDLT